MEYSGTRCGDYYLIPRRLTALIRGKILDSAVNEVSEALSMHVAPPSHTNCCGTRRSDSPVRAL
jgi:hypothetical protein